MINQIISWHHKNYLNAVLYIMIRTRKRRLYYCSYYIMHDVIFSCRSMLISIIIFSSFKEDDIFIFFGMREEAND
jgi:hypothetical protein